jgi:hypothetical protein
MSLRVVIEWRASLSPGNAAFPKYFRRGWWHAGHYVRISHLVVLRLRDPDPELLPGPGCVLGAQ